jgi:hypothetical protein
MEQSKHSEEQIIKLGKKLIKELDLQYSVNTLARWMSHYIAELIHNIDTAKSKEEKKLMQQECCDEILKIWSQKENLPITKPLDDLKPVIEILQVFKENNEDNVLPRWIGRHNKFPRENQWAHLVDLIKNNSEETYNRIIQMNLHKDILCKDKEWMKENKAFLTDDQIHFLELIDIFTDNNFNSGSIDLNYSELSDDNAKRIEYMFDKVEKLIDEQKKELLKIKETYIKKTL